MRKFLGGVAVALLLNSGCGPSASLKRDPVDVTGKVTMNGAPLGNVVLHVQATDSSLSTQTQANLGADGRSL